MDTNEIITNDEIIEVTEEVLNDGYSKGVIAVGVIGLAIIGCGIAYKYAVKPLMAKLKEKKKLPKIVDDDWDTETDDEEDYDECED